MCFQFYTKVNRSISCRILLCVHENRKLFSKWYRRKKKEKNISNFILLMKSVESFMSIICAAIHSFKHAKKKRNSTERQWINWLCVLNAFIITYLFSTFTENREKKNFILFIIQEIQLTHSVVASFSLFLCFSCFYIYISFLCVYVDVFLCLLFFFSGGFSLRWKRDFCTSTLIF